MNRKHLYLHIGFIYIIALLFIIGYMYHAYVEIVILTAFLHLLFGFFLYFKHGGTFVSCLGAFALATVYFHALPPLYLYPIGEISLGYYEMIVSFVSFFSLAIISLLSASNENIQENQGEIAVIFEKYYKNAPLSVIGIGFIFLLSSFIINVLPVSIFDSFEEPAAFLGIACFALILILSFRQRKYVTFLLSFCMLLVAFYLYDVVVFTGAGRLRLVSIGFLLLIIFCMFIKWKWVKVAPILASPLFLIWSGMIRGSSDITKVIFEASGLRSVFDPYTILTTLVKDFQSISGEFMFGMSYINNIFLLVPREFWSEKPVGIGSLYVEWLYPGHSSGGYSLAASYLGEAYSNWWFLGFIVAPVLIGYFIRFIDLNISKWVCKSSFTTVMVFKLLIFIILLAGMFELVWGSSNAFFHRGGLRAVLLFVVIYSFYYVNNGIKKG